MMDGKNWCGAAGSPLAHVVVVVVTVVCCLVAPGYRNATGLLVPSCWACLLGCEITTSVGRAEAAKVSCLPLLFSFGLFLILGDVFLLVPFLEPQLKIWHSWWSVGLTTALLSSPSCFQCRSWFQSCGFVWMRVGLLILPGGFLGSGGGKRCRINFDTKLGHPQQSLTTFCLLSCNKSLVVMYFTFPITVLVSWGECWSVYCCCWSTSSTRIPNLRGVVPCFHFAA